MKNILIMGIGRAEKTTLSKMIKDKYKKPIIIKKQNPYNPVLQVYIDATLGK